MMNYQQDQPFWTSQQQQQYYYRHPMTSSPSYRSTHSAIQHKKQSRPIPSSGPIMSKPGCRYGNNSIAPQQQRQQKQGYQYHYGAPPAIIPQQQSSLSPHHRYAPTSPIEANDCNVDHFRRVSMGASTTPTKIMPQRRISLGVASSSHNHHYHRTSSFQHNNSISPGLNYYSPVKPVARKTLTASSQQKLHYGTRSPLPSMSQQQQHQQYHHQQHQQTVAYRRSTNLARSTSIVTHKSIEPTVGSGAHDCQSSLPTKPLFQYRYSSSERLTDNYRLNDGATRKITPFQMASIAEEKRSNFSTEEDEVPLAMLASNSNKHQQKHYSNTYPTMKKHSSVKQQQEEQQEQQQYASIKMTSRCNSVSTESSSSRPSFFSKDSNNSVSISDESGLTSNCSTIHQQKHESSLPSSPSVVANLTLHNKSTSFEAKKQRRQRKPSVTKRFFSSMHRLSKVVLISSASSSNAKSDVKRQ
ncbi:hypothetical protein INT45_007118 [Circinella minor]|uniref:Uncharacterized protein n=1 Tax=Circinella minor TaxID=1195481 RepID=A0A8H7SAP2_9FUNG|nr:hypothetical protein INT45_007118 [Circinella minor]